jgi:hypothetical protein
MAVIVRKIVDARVGYVIQRSINAILYVQDSTQIKSFQMDVIVMMVRNVLLRIVYLENARVFAKLMDVIVNLILNVHLQHIHAKKISVNLQRIATQIL